MSFTFDCPNDPRNYVAGCPKAIRLSNKCVDKYRFVCPFWGCSFFQEIMFENIFSVNCFFHQELGTVRRCQIRDAACSK